MSDFASWLDIVDKLGSVVGAAAGVLTLVLERARQIWALGVAWGLSARRLRAAVRCVRDYRPGWIGG